MELIQLRTGAELWVVFRIDGTNAERFPCTWWDAFKARWCPWLGVNYTRAFRAWHIQGIYSDEQKARASCQDDSWFYFPFLMNVAYPLERVEVQCVFPLRDNEEFTIPHFR